MSSGTAEPIAGRLLTGSSPWAHLTLALLVSAAYESLFLSHGVNPLDEGWQIYVASRLHEGGTLYDDVFWVFPPGHVLVAWIGWVLDPPGIFVGRILYAAWTVALVGATYLLGRRLMPAPWALLGALLLAVAAPSSHMSQLIFGYRYLVLPTLGLVLLGRWLRSHDARWLAGAGALGGLSFVFRISPAFAYSCAVGVALVVSSRDPRIWFRNGAVFAAGFLAVAAPVVGYLAADVGFETLWREVVMRPVAMVDRQSHPLPMLDFPHRFTWTSFAKWWSAFQFRAWSLLYAGYGLVLLALWLRSLRRRVTYPHVLLLSLVVFGGVFFTRSMGRSDTPHLESAIPPVCLLLAHFLWRFVRWVRSEGAGGKLGVEDAVAMLLASTLWVVLPGTYHFVDPDFRGRVPLRTAGGQTHQRTDGGWLAVDPTVAWIQSQTEPGEMVLDLAHAPLLHVLSGRPGPGYADVVMPGTFLNAAEEHAFVERLRAAPPRVVILPDRDFDEIPERGLRATAPELDRFVRRRYRPVRTWKLAWPRFVLLLQRGEKERPQSRRTGG